MQRFLALLALCLPLLARAGDYQSTLLVQTGQLRESDLIVRTISDLESNRICLAFYVRTTGTSPAMTCYDVVSGYRSNIEQVGHFKADKLVVRQLKDSINNVSCLVAYVSTKGTSPAIDCYGSATGGAKFRDAGSLKPDSHLREGDLDVYKFADPNSTKSCLIAYVDTENTAPSLHCYGNRTRSGASSLTQTNQLHEGDLIVRKILDTSSNKECLITYVSTAGTSPHIYCAESRSAPAPGNASSPATDTAPDKGEQPKWRPQKYSPWTSSP